MSLFPIAPRESMVDACAQAVRDAILRGELAAGERLPGERVLCQKLGVSRLTLRAALAKVAATGLIVVKHGSGYRVQDFRRRGGPDLIADLVEMAARKTEQVAIAGELLRVRRHLARAVLERLAELDAPTGKVPRQLAEAVENFGELAARGSPPSELAQADLRIVAALVDETKSPVFGLCLNPITQILSQLPALRDAMYAEPAGNADGWRMLLAWVGSPRADLIEVIVAELERRDRFTLGRLEKSWSRM